MGIEYMGVKGMTHGNNSEVGGFAGLAFMPALNDACQYSTVYDEATDRPLGTLQRRSALDYGRGPVWKLYATDGSLLRQWHLRPSYRALAKATREIFTRRANVR